MKSSLRLISRCVLSLTPVLAACLAGWAAPAAVDIPPSAPLFRCSFESDEWFKAWGESAADEHLQLVAEDPDRGFVPLRGRALRVRIDQGGHYGGSLEYRFKRRIGSEPEEIYFRYYLRLADDWNPEQGGKLPGLAATYGRAGWGGRPVNGRDGWSARGLFLGRKDGRTPVGFYCYHVDMKGRYGSNWVWDREERGYLENNRWYAIEQYARLNNPGQNDGILRAWIDGKLAFEKTDVRMRDVPDLKIETVWLNVYYGGTWTAPVNYHLYIDEVVVARQPIGVLAQAAQPRLVGDWWPVAGNPDLGAYTSDRQQPVDFAMWQARDGTWQLWSCIRHTKCGGNTRLFHRWEGSDLTTPHWQPMGIAMEADPALGESPGGLQAPHVFKEGDRYYMVYGDWRRICLAASQDGKQFQRVLNQHGQPDLFSGPYDNSRDPMVLKWEGRFYCYYMGHKKDATHQSAIFCRTSTDLKQWSEPVLVSAGGAAATQTDWYGGDAECPFVLRQGDLFYLFRNQRYGRNNLNTQYTSTDPLNFGVGNDQGRMGTLPVAAPEIIFHQGEWFIAALNPGLDGIRVARLAWAMP